MNSVCSMHRYCATPKTKSTSSKKHTIAKKPITIKQSACDDAYHSCLVSSQNPYDEYLLQKCIQKCAEANAYLCDPNDSY